MSHAHSVTVLLSWKDAAQGTGEPLGEQGFGLFTEIGVRATFDSRLGADAADAVREYTIRSACKPPPWTAAAPDA